MKTVEGITMNPKVMVGKPCITGTRITVELILEKLEAGESFDEILTSYPHLTRDGLRAAVRFARQSLGSELVHPLPTAAAVEA